MMARGHVRMLQYKEMRLKRELDAIRLARRALRLGISPNNVRCHRTKPKETENG
jgi:hypothetical protein